MAEISPEEQSEKTQSCRENLCNEIQLKGPQRQKQTQEQIKKKRSWQACLVYENSTETRMRWKDRYCYSIKTEDSLSRQKHSTVVDGYFRKYGLCHTEKERGEGSN